MVNSKLNLATDMSDLFDRLKGMEKLHLKEKKLGELLASSKNSSREHRIRNLLQVKVSLFWANPKGPHKGLARSSFSKFRALGSALGRDRQYTSTEPVKVRQENMTAAWGSARSMLSKSLAFREISFLKRL